ncbi:hypothetical protein EDC04DRAFT_2894023 [Pisolithus marmoratus]|nr:hypothetical protein EDC04DRAFT_2894023 [Pisolithus marmoratus]
MVGAPSAAKSGALTNVVSPSNAPDQAEDTSDILPVFDRRKVPCRAEEEQQQQPHVAPIMTRLQQTIYLAFLGVPSLDELEKISKQRGQWSEFKALLTDRTNNVGVIAALVVTSSAVYVAATPPTDISKWLRQFSYIFMITSYGSGMLSIVFSFAQVIYLSFMGPGDVVKAQSSKLHRAALFMLLVLPLGLLIVAAACAGIGFSAAFWFGSIDWFKSYYIMTDVLHLTLKVYLVS